MMNKEEEKCCRIVINFMTDEEISTLLDKVAKKKMGNWSKQDAIQLILRTDTAEQLLKRPQIKPEYLFKYFQKIKVYPPASSTKKALIDMALKTCVKKNQEMSNVTPVKIKASNEGARTSGPSPTAGTSYMSAFVSPLAAPISVRPPINESNVQQLMELGFSRAECINALTHKQSIEEATEYLLRSSDGKTPIQMGQGENENVGFGANLSFRTLFDKQEPGTKETSQHSKQAVKRPAADSDILKIKKAYHEKELVLQEKKKAYLKAEAEMVKEQKKFFNAVTNYFAAKTNSSADNLSSFKYNLEMSIDFCNFTEMYSIFQAFLNVCVNVNKCNEFITSASLLLNVFKRK